MNEDTILTTSDKHKGPRLSWSQSLSIVSNSMTCPIANNILKTKLQFLLFCDRGKILCLLCPVCGSKNRVSGLNSERGGVKGDLQGSSRFLWRVRFFLFVCFVFPDRASLKVEVLSWKWRLMRCL